jgi:type I restriction-modification system DNA methylase subunit
LFIDARKLGRMVHRTHRELNDADIRRIADTYHAWRSNPKNPHPASGELRVKDAERIVQRQDATAQRRKEGSC